MYEGSISPDNFFSFVIKVARLFNCLLIQLTNSFKSSVFTLSADLNSLFHHNSYPYFYDEWKYLCHVINFKSNLLSIKTGVYDVQMYLIWFLLNVQYTSQTSAEWHFYLDIQISFSFFSNFRFNAKELTICFCQ